MVDVIYRPEVLLDPVGEWSRAQLPATVKVGGEERPLTVWVHDVPAEADPPLVYLALSTRPAPEATGMGWEDHAQVVVVARFEGATASQTLMLAGRFRERWCGRARRGDYATAMPLPGVHITRRWSDEDGALDSAGGRPQWTETFRASYTRA